MTYEDLWTVTDEAIERLDLKERFLATVSTRGVGEMLAKMDRIKGQNFIDLNANLLKKYGWCGTYTEKTSSVLTPVFFDLACQGWSIPFLGT